MKSATKIRGAMKKHVSTKKMAEKDKEEGQWQWCTGPWRKGTLMAVPPFERE